MTAKKQTNKRYPEAFKQEAVALVLQQGYTITEADAVGVDRKLIYNWKNKIEQAKAPTALSSSERAELLALRKENKNLRIEREILKNASAFFAKEIK